MRSTTLNVSKSTCSTAKHLLAIVVLYVYVGFGPINFAESIFKVNFEISLQHTIPKMNLLMNQRLATSYRSQSQKIRVSTELWVKTNAYCPNCGLSYVEKFENNRPVADFFCLKCKEEFELKSKKNHITGKIVDGAYRTMIDRLRDDHNPNFFLLSYDTHSFSILNFLVIPKHFFVPDIIEKRKPLSLGARRSGWTGCNILLNSIPTQGKIFIVKNGQILPKRAVLNSWRKTIFLRDESEFMTRGWILDILNCINTLHTQEFTLSNLYQFENALQKKYPANKHIKDKIRQQLQLLRDHGYLSFTGRGRYRLIG